jgi:hypothetical protein
MALPLEPIVDVNIADINDVCLEPMCVLASSAMIARVAPPRDDPVVGLWKWVRVPSPYGQLTWWPVNVVGEELCCRGTRPTHSQSDDAAFVGSPVRIQGM